MPKYRLPSGKSFFSETDLSPDELDEMMNELEPTQETVTPPIQNTAPNFSNVASASSTSAQPVEPAFFESMEGKSPIEALSDPTTLAFRRRSEKDTKEHFAPARQDTDNEFMASVIGALEGANEGAGEVLTSMSAPVDLLAQLTGVKGAAQAARYARLAGKIGSGGTAIRGGSNLFGPDKSISERASGLAEMIMGALGTGKVPDVSTAKAKPPVKSPYTGEVIDTTEAPLGKSAYAGDETVVNKPSEDFNPRPPEPELEATIRTNDTQTKRAKEIILKHHGPEQAAEIFRVKPEAELMDYAKTLIPEKSVVPDVANEASKLPKIRVKANLDGSFTDSVTGETVDNLKNLFKAPVKPTTPYGSDPVTVTNSQGLEPPPLSNKYTGKPAVVTNSQGVVPAKSAKIKVSPAGEIVDGYTGKPVDITNNQGKINIDPKDKVSPAKPRRMPQPQTTGPGGEKLPEEHIIAQGMNVARAAQTSTDMSFPLRQGLGQIHTKAWWKMLGGMIKSYGSKPVYDGIVKSVQDHPDFQFAMDNGLALPDLNTRMEEMHQSNLAERIPLLGRGVKASGRAYNAAALPLRMDNFAAAIKVAEEIYKVAKKTGSARTGIMPFKTKFSPESIEAVQAGRNKMGFVERQFSPDSVEMLNPRTNLKLAREIAEMVNVTSGRGSLGRLEKIVGELNTLIYSPRFVKSRLDMLNPMRYAMATPQVRKEYAKSALTMAAFWGFTTQMARLLPGVEVADDPDSSDFGKIKIGNTRFDPPAGLQQYIVLLHRLASGERTSSTTGESREYTKFGGEGRLGLIGNFAMNKLAPIPSAAARFINATTNRPFEVGEEIVKLFTPMTVATFSEILQDNPWLLPGIIPAGLGVGTQTYDDDPTTPDSKIGFGYFPPTSMEISIPSKQ